MPSLIDAANAFSKLGKRSVDVHEAACVRVRNRHASCNACARVCSHEAIAIENNALAIDNAFCTGCGACTSVCPTQALRLIEDVDEAALAEIDAAGVQEDLEASGAVELICEHARNAQAAIAESGSLPWNNRALAVPCLASVDESVLVHGACAGVEIRYFSADCAECPNANGELIGDIVIQAKRLLSGFSLDFEHPCELVLSWYAAGKRTDDEIPASHDTSPEMTRRGMFDQLVARTTDSVAEAAAHTFYATHASPDQKPSLAQTLKASINTLKKVDVPRNTQVLDDLYSTHAHGDASEAAIIPTRMFGEVELDPVACDLCGTCMTFCPTKALSGKPNTKEPINPFHDLPREENLSGELWFRANDCVNCGLCVDVCPQNALTLRPGIASEDLFALEPRVLMIR